MSPEHAPRPVEVSVVIASYNARGTISRSLASLTAQQTARPYEVIVVDSSTDDTADIVEESFPTVRLIRCESRRFAGHARNIGIAQAKGPVLALTDADCVAAPDWVERIALAHDSPQAVIGGVVDVGNPDCWTGWGYYFAEFHQWRPGSPAGQVDDIPGCCLSFGRAAFDRWGPFLEGTYCSDTAFHWNMAADGYRPHLDPTIRVAHLNPERLGPMLSHGVLHGRHFAVVRSNQLSLSRGRVLVHALVSPLLPVVLLFRAANRMRQNRTYAGRFALTWPLALASLGAWSLGEMRGYLASLRTVRS